MTITHYDDHDNLDWSSLLANWAAMPSADKLINDQVAWQTPGASLFCDHGKIKLKYWPIADPKGHILFLPPWFYTDAITDLLPKSSLVASAKAYGWQPWVIDWGFPWNQSIDDQKTWSELLHWLKQSWQSIASVYHSPHRLMVGICQGGHVALALAKEMLRDSDQVILIQTPLDCLDSQFVLGQCLQCLVDVSISYPMEISSWLIRWFLQQYQPWTQALTSPARASSNQPFYQALAAWQKQSALPYALCHSYLMEYFLPNQSRADAAAFSSRLITTHASNDLLVPSSTSHPVGCGGMVWYYRGGHLGWLKSASFWQSWHNYLK